LTEDIITHLSRIRDFDVIARNSTEAYHSGVRNRISVGAIT